MRYKYEVISHFYCNHSFAHLFNFSGIMHQVSCLYTLEQNGLVERKHHHLLETTKTLLKTASLSYKFWLEVLYAAVYLINRMPSYSINHKTPYQLLYGKKLVYSHFKVFGCACFPWIPPSAHHKLAPKTIPCIFIGYDSLYKGYRCFNPETNQVIILCSTK